MNIPDQENTALGHVAGLEDGLDVNARRGGGTISSWHARQSAYRQVYRQSGYGNQQRARHRAESLPSRALVQSLGEPQPAPRVVPLLLPGVSDYPFYPHPLLYPQPTSDINTTTQGPP